MSFNVMSAQEKPDRVIANDGFFPELSLRTFLGLYRLPGEYAADLVADHLTLAVVWANRQLEAWKAARKGEGCSTLGDVPLHGVPGSNAGRRPTTTPRKAARRRMSFLPLPTMRLPTCSAPAAWT